MVHSGWVGGWENRVDTTGILYQIFLVVILYSVAIAMQCTCTSYIYSDILCGNLSIVAMFS